MRGADAFLIRCAVVLFVTVVALLIGWHLIRRKPSPSRALAFAVVMTCWAWWARGYRDRWDEGMPPRGDSWGLPIEWEQPQDTEPK
jgi:hypothetical protein